MSRNGAPVRGIVFDGDDTLWRTEELYDRARQEARGIVAQAGLDGKHWEAIERRLDIENVERFGHAADRFPTSCVEAYEIVRREEGRPADSAVAAAVAKAARRVFTDAAPLLPDARETLAELHARGLRLALLTKGDPTVQRRRVDQSGLVPYFDLVEIVDQKTPETIAGAVATLGVDPASALSVGNSIRSDVLPSLEAGIRPVWIDAHVWEYEREHDAIEDERVVQVDRLGRLLELTETT
jgi:putative hydrolase of the HAD superfamily